MADTNILVSLLFFPSPLASAIEHDADVLLTGDKDFLALNIKKPRIMSMSQFLEAFAH